MCWGRGGAREAEEDMEGEREEGLEESSSFSPAMYLELLSPGSL